MIMSGVSICITPYRLFTNSKKNGKKPLKMMSRDMSYHVVTKHPDKLSASPMHGARSK
jgi:hypothetical protein